MGDVFVIVGTQIESMGQRQQLWLCYQIVFSVCLL